MIPCDPPLLDRSPDGAIEFPPVLAPDMPEVELDEETIRRLDALRIEDESHDEVIDELINIYQAEELTLFRSGDG